MMAEFPLDLAQLVHMVVYWLTEITTACKKQIFQSSTYPEVVGPHAFIFGMLVAKMIKLLVQDIRVKGHVDSSVKAIGDTDTMGSELRAVDVCNVDIGEQVLGGWFLLKESTRYI